MSFLTPIHLKTVCTAVEPGEFVGHIIAKMRIAVEGGVGLAANQVGETKRIILIQTPTFRQVIINPVIIRKYGGTIMSTEGCLSFPGKRVRVSRHTRVEVEGLDAEGQTIKFNLKNLNAIVIQHEVDHLNGITCIDKALRGVR